MEIEQKQNKIFRPQSVYTFSAEEINQVSAELQNVITEGGLVPSASDTTQVKTAIRNMIGTGGNFIPDYSAGVSKTWNTEYTATENGWLFIESVLVEQGEATKLIVNGIVVVENFGLFDTDYTTHLIPVGKDDIYKATGGTQGQSVLIFYPNRSNI